MGRSDISNELIHFTREIQSSTVPKYEGAFNRLKKIISDRKLIGSNGFIKGSYRCVCFSEAPFASVQDGLVNESAYSKYSPFGIMVSKKWLFSQGGRPVIYQPEAEREELPESHRWRHVKYEIREGHSKSDFTWEREWRIKCDELPFDPASATIIVPDEHWAKRVIQEHEDEQHFRVQQYSIIVGEIAEFYREPFVWTMSPLIGKARI